MFHSTKFYFNTNFLPSLKRIFKYAYKIFIKSFYHVYRKSNSFQKFFPPLFDLQLASFCIVSGEINIDYFVTCMYLSASTQICFTHKACHQRWIDAGSPSNYTLKVLWHEIIMEWSFKVIHFTTSCNVGNYSATRQSVALSFSIEIFNLRVSIICFETFIHILRLHQRLPLMYMVFNYK